MATMDDARAQVEAARAALDDDIATLTDRLPAAQVIASAGAAGGTGLALLGVLAKQVQKRLARRSEEQALTREAEIQARAIAAAIAAAGLHGHGTPAQDAGTDAPASRPAPRPKVEVPVPAPSGDDGDGDGPPWGILLLLAGLVAAVVAIVTGGSDDEAIWDSPR